MTVRRTEREIEGRDSVGLYLDEIARTPLLDAITEVELSKTIEAGLFAANLLEEGRVGRRKGGAPGLATQAELEWMVEEGERAVQQSSGDLPAIRHFAQRGGFERRWHVGIDRLHRRKDRDSHLFRAEIVREIDRILRNVDLAFQVRCDVDRRIGDYERLVMVRHVHDEAMADAP